jgi:hypothetical protein
MPPFFCCCLPYKHALFSRELCLATRLHVRIYYFWQQVLLCILIHWDNTCIHTSLRKVSVICHPIYDVRIIGLIINLSSKLNLAKIQYKKCNAQDMAKSLELEFKMIVFVKYDKVQAKWWKWWVVDESNPWVVPKTENHLIFLSTVNRSPIFKIGKNYFLINWGFLIWLYEYT